MKKFNINLLISRLNLFDLLDYVNNLISDVAEDGTVIYSDPIQLLLSIQPSEHLILVQSNDDKLYSYLDELDIDYCDDLSKIDLQFQDKYWKQTVANIQSCSNPDNDYSYSNTRSTVSDE